MTSGRNARAAQLLETGFLNYWWKSIFGGESLDTLAIQASLVAGPRNMRRHIRSCRVRVYRKKKKRLHKKKTGAKTAKVAPAKAGGALVLLEVESCPDCRRPAIQR